MGSPSISRQVTKVVAHTLHTEAAHTIRMAVATMEVSANMILMAIDPSIGSSNSLGYAFLETAGRPMSVGSLSQVAGKQLDYRLRGILMGRAVYDLVDCARDTPLSLITPGEKSVVVIIETQSNWFTPRSMKSKDSESIQKLYYTTAAIISSLLQHPSVASIWATSPAWKGVVPKDVMVKRALRHVEKHDCSLDRPSHDAAEALLLGKWALSHRRDENAIPMFDSKLVRVDAHSGIAHQVWEHLSPTWIGSG